MQVEQRARAVIGPMVLEYYEKLKDVVDAIGVTDAKRRALPAQKGFDKAAAAVLACGKRGGKLVFIGNGASASIASHQAVDFWKGTGIRAISFNDAALLTCISNDYGYERVFEKPLSLFLEPKDLLVAISSSGRSANILRAASLCRKKSAFLLTLSGFSAVNPLRKLGDLNFYVPAQTYGLIEVAHHSILHCLLDALVRSRRHGH